MVIDWDAQPDVLAMLRLQARIDGDEEDALLKSYTSAALAHIEMHCDRKLVELTPGVELLPEQMELTPDVWQAVVLLVTHWYANREAVAIGIIATTVPLGFERLLWYRKRF
jgi:uncharacterized phage protein (predicted DNA packaging)